MSITTKVANEGIYVYHALLTLSKKSKSRQSPDLYSNINQVLQPVLNKENKNLVEGLKNKSVKKISFDSDHVVFQLAGGNRIYVPAKSNDLNGLKLDVSPLDAVVDGVVSETKFERVLYLYSSGGGGHISTKNAVRDTRLKQLKKDVKEALKGKYGKDQGKDVFTHYFPNWDEDFVKYCKKKGLFEEKDVLLDFVGYAGRKGATQWNDAQTSGDVEAQERIFKLQPIARVLFAIPVFLSTLYTLIKYKPDLVISTQANNNDAILSAMAVYNILFSPKHSLHMHLYLTDMPTDLAKHFFDGIKSMFSGQKELLFIFSPKPTDEGFNWEVKVGLKGEHVTVLENLELPIRPAFFRAVKKFQETDFDPKKLTLKVWGNVERELLEATIGTDAIQGASVAGPHTVEYSLGESDHADFILLGSQPTRDAIYGYINAKIVKAKQNPSQTSHLFLFTGLFKENCFYKELAQYLKDNKDQIPTNLKIVPLSFQDADQIVGLYARCDSITRSGGATCMELLVMEEVCNAIKAKNPAYQKPKRYIHSQVVKGRSEEDSIPLWEKGNYNFIKDKCGAKIITPHMLLRR